MQPNEVVIATNQIAINENLREHTAATALTPGLKTRIAVDCVELIRDCKPVEQLCCSVTPGTARKHRHLNTFLHRGCLCRRQTAHPQQQLSTLQHNRAGLQVAAPDLTGSVGKAEMEMDGFRGKGAVQGDDLQLSRQTCRLLLSRTLERCLRKIADNSEDKSTEFMLSSKGCLLYTSDAADE